MCKGLAIVVEKINNEWIVYAKAGESSHDKLLHELRDDLRYGKVPHLKFEIIFPNIIKDDIQQNVGYPDNWIEIQYGKQVAVYDAFNAVSKHFKEHPELQKFTVKMLFGANLTGANLIGADLIGADLSGANLTGADLIGADLTGADLIGADLTKANLTGADLTGTNLYRADLTEANLTGADLSGTDLYRADLTRTNLSGANLSGTDLYRADLTRTNLTGTNLYRADLTEANLTGAQYNKYTIFPKNFQIPLNMFTI